MKNKPFLKWAAAVVACWGLLWVAGAMAQQPPTVSAAETAAAETSSAEKTGTGKTQPDAEEPSAEEPSAEEPGAEEPTSMWEDLNLGGLVLEDNRWYHWLILAAAIVLGWAAGRLAAAVLQRAVERLQRRDRPVRTHVLRDLIGPAKLALLSAGVFAGLAVLTMADPLQNFCRNVLLLLYSIAVFWYAYNLVSVVEVVLRRLTAKTESPLDDQLVPLIRKGLRICLVVVAVIFVVGSVFERDVFALVAALGVLGLPLGFAAQDALKNLFGAIIILFNRPFQVGERISYGGYDGVIEEIGFQTIKVRTLTGHQVTIPNCKIASDPVENIGRRPSIRRILNVTITYDTPREKIEQAVQILRDILEEPELHEPIHQAIDGNEYPPRVYFNDFNADSLNIMVIYWFIPPAYWDFVEHGQKLNLRIFDEFEKAGIEFAFPTQTLYLAGDPKRELAVKMLGADVSPP